MDEENEKRCGNCIHFRRPETWEMTTNSECRLFEITTKMSGEPCERYERSES